MSWGIKAGSCCLYFMPFLCFNYINIFGFVSLPEHFCVLSISDWPEYNVRKKADKWWGWSSSFVCYRRPCSPCWSCSEPQSSGVPIWGRVSCSALSPLQFHPGWCGSSVLHFCRHICSPTSQRQPQSGWVCPHADTGLGRDLHTETVWYANCTEYQQQKKE